MELVIEVGQSANDGIPEGWSRLTILDACSQIIDFRGRTPKKLGMEWGGGNIPALSAGNVKMGYIDLKAETYFASDDLYRRWMTNGDAQKDDLVITMEAPLGNVALVPDNRKYILSQRTILLKVNPKRFESKYLFHLMTSAKFQSLLAENSTGSTAKGIQRKRFEKLYVLAPPLEEQRAIATALNDVDALLSSLDQLIAKKCNIKGAAIYQLLTGRRRLPGFDGGWTTCDLRSITCDFIVPMRDKPFAFRGEVPWCRIEDLDGMYLSRSKSGRAVDAGIISQMNLQVCPIGTLLVSCSADLGRCAIVSKPLITNQTFIGLALDQSRVSAEFMYYLMSFNAGKLNNLSTGTTISYLPREKFESFRVTIPLCREEQSAIASVLADMDAEIVALEDRRAKTQEIKQGMMQELLTGRIRLV